MRAIKVLIEPFQFITLLKIKSVKALNNHGHITIAGIISEKDSMAYFNATLEECPVCIKVVEDDGNEMIFFQGIVTSLAVQTEGGVYQLKIEAKTGSYLLDKVLHTRFFQNSNECYETLMRGILRPDGGDVLMVDCDNERIGTLLVQYQETNWEFCKRLANNLGLVLVPEFQQSGKFIHAGVQAVTGRTMESDSYRLKQSDENKEESSLIWERQGIYQVFSREIYNLGESVIFNGQKRIVSKIDSWLEGSELCHCYELCLLKPALERVRYNHKIQGVAMQGQVEKVEGIKVQVSLYQDENKTMGGHWFDYATVYSTPDGTGWFCMPEIGDEIRLVFPEEEECKAYVAGSVHLNGSGGRNDSNQKFWKNKWNKEIRFTPDSLLLTNNAGLSISLSDASGIQIASNNGIHLSAKQDITIDSESELAISGKNEVSIVQGNSSIRMRHEINISGGKINMN